MKRLLFLVPLFLLLTLLSACEVKVGKDQISEYLDIYSGSYQIMFMDWTADGDVVTTVDVNNDGHSCNDIYTEICHLDSRVLDAVAHFVPDNDCSNGTLYLSLPIIGYYDSIDYNNPIYIIEFPTFALNTTISDDGTLKSNIFDGFDWPSEKQIGLKAFKGVTISQSHPGTICVSVDNYMVYDFKTERLLNGSMTVWLTKCSE